MVEKNYLGKNKNNNQYSNVNTGIPAETPGTPFTRRLKFTDCNGYYSTPISMNDFNFSLKSIAQLDQGTSQIYNDQSTSRCQPLYQQGQSSESSSNVKYTKPLLPLPIPLQQESTNNFRPPDSFVSPIKSKMLFSDTITPNAFNYRPLMDNIEIPQEFTEVNLNEYDIGYMTELDRQLQELFIKSKFVIFCLIMAVLPLIAMIILAAVYFTTSLSKAISLIAFCAIEVVLLLSACIFVGLGSHEVVQLGSYKIIPYFVIAFKILFHGGKYCMLDDWFGDSKYLFVHYRLNEGMHKMAQSEELTTPDRIYGKWSNNLNKY